ncbi:MAG: hypothetical protein WC273_10920 [Dehalococcoidia bacterium]
MRLLSAVIYEDIEYEAFGTRLVGRRRRVSPLASLAPIHGDVGILIEFQILPTEYDREVMTELRLVTPDARGGLVLQTVRQAIPRDPRWQKGYRLPDFEFEAPGPHEFQFCVDGTTAATIPLEVELLA